MKEPTKNETAGVGAPAASETENQTSEIESTESTRDLAESAPASKDSFNISGVITYVPTSELHSHPLNAEIYGETTVDDALVESVKTYGVIQPLVITSGKEILAGNRRHLAAEKAGLKEIPVVVLDSRKDVDIKSAMVETNKQRVKTNEQIGREYLLLVEVEAERAHIRMGNKAGGKALTPAEKGKTRDQAAKKIGDISGVSAQRAGIVVGVIDSYKKKGWKNKVEELRDALNRNIEKAYKVCKPKEDSSNARAGSNTGPTNPAKPSAPTPPTPVASGNAIAASGSTGDEQSDSNASKESEETDAEQQGLDNGTERSAGDKIDHEEALEFTDNVVTFFRTRESTKLTDKQKSDWKKVVEELVNYLRAVGVKVATV